jgi:transposase
MMKKRQHRTEDFYFDLFKKHPRMTVLQLSKRYGLPKSTLYRYQKRYRDGMQGTPIEAMYADKKVEKDISIFKKHCSKTVQGAFVTGVALGALMTIFAFMIK